MRAYAMAVVLFLVGCNSDLSPTETAKAVVRCDEDEYRRAALERLYPILGDSISATSAFYGDVDQPRVDKRRNEIERLRVWAKTVEDVCARRAYLRWLDHHDRQLNEAEEELRTGARRKRHEEYVRRSNEEDVRARELAERLPVPPRAK
jgi:hypothetical protein